MRDFNVVVSEEAMDPFGETFAQEKTFMIIPPNWTLPEAIRIRLGKNTYGRQRVIAEGGHVLLVLHQPPGADDSKREGVLFWRQPSGEWQASRGGTGPGALKRHIQSFSELETKLTEQFEAAGDMKELFDLVEALTPLARSARNMHAAVQDAREVIKGDPFIIEMRDLAYEAERNLDLLLEDVRLGIQYRTAREEEKQAKAGQEALRASHRLNVLASLFLPVTALASVFGMNFVHPLDDKNSLHWWVVLGAGIVFGFGVKSWVTAKDR